MQDFHTRYTVWNKHCPCSFSFLEFSERHLPDLKYDPIWGYLNKPLRPFPPTLPDRGRFLWRDQCAACSLPLLPAWRLPTETLEEIDTEGRGLLDRPPTHLPQYTCENHHRAVLFDQRMCANIRIRQDFSIRSSCTACMYESHATLYPGYLDPIVLPNWERVDNVE